MFTTQCPLGVAVFLEEYCDWRSKKQCLVEKSNAKAEFCVPAPGCVEPMKHYYNNNSAMRIAYSLVQHDQIEHVKVNRRFIKSNLVVAQHHTSLYKDN